MQEVEQKHRRREREEHNKIKESWDRRRKELESDILLLQEELEHSLEKIKERQIQQKVVIEQH